MKYGLNKHEKMDSERIAKGLHYDMTKHEKMDRERIAKGLHKALLYVMISLGLTFWALIIAMFGSGRVQAASFDCSKASTKVELEICSDAVLGVLDEDIAKLYSQARDLYPTAKPEQRQWLKERNKLSGSALVAFHMERKMVLQAEIAANGQARAQALPEKPVADKPEPKASGFQCDHDMATGCEIQENNWKAEQSQKALSKKKASNLEAALAVLDYIDDNEQFPATFGHHDSDMGEGGFKIDRFLKSGVGKHDRCAKTGAYNYAWELIHLVDRSGKRGTQSESYFWPLYYGANNALLYILQEHPDRYNTICK